MAYENLFSAATSKAKGGYDRPDVFNTKQKKHLAFVRCFFCSLAEREGFEPPEQLPVHRISSAARSTTPASFLASLVAPMARPTAVQIYELLSLVVPPGPIFLQKSQLRSIPSRTRNPSRVSENASQRANFRDFSYICNNFVARCVKYKVMRLCSPTSAARQDRPTRPTDKTDQIE